MESISAQKVYALDMPNKGGGTVATILKAQKGPQETFLSTPADIALYGGAAG